MGFGSVGILRFSFERLNDHRHVHNQCARARGCVYMYLIFVMTGQNISNDGDKGAQICISPTFIEPRALVWHASMLNARLVSDTDGRTDRRR